MEEAGVFFGDGLWVCFELAADLGGSVFEVTLFGDFGLHLSRSRAWDVSAYMLTSFDYRYSSIADLWKDHLPAWKLQK